MLKKILKNYQLFVSYKNNVSNVERYYPVVSLKKGMKEVVELDLYNLLIESKNSPRKGIDINLNGKLINLKFGEMVSLNTKHGVLSLRIINDWTFNSTHNFSRFFYYSIAAHLFIVAALAFPKLLKAEEKMIEPDKKTEERISSMLEKIEEKEPKKIKKEKPKKEVKKIVVQKKEKKVGALDFSKNKKKKRKRRVNRSSFKNTSGKVTKTTNGGGGKVTSKNVAKSLDFLGGSNNSGKVAVNTGGSKSKSGSRGFGSSKGGVPIKGITSNGGALKGGGNYSGAIETTGVRGVKSAKYKGSGSGGGTGYAKTLNNVEGRVSAKTLGRSNKGNIGGSIRRSGSLKVSGKGRVSQKDIEKAIKKKMYRLVYCYEKTLLSKPNASGTIKIQWTITSKRKVRKVRIVKSQIKDKKLYKCLKKELSKIKFPRPKGGDATVVYPFKFVK